MNFTPLIPGGGNSSIGAILIGLAGLVVLAVCAVRLFRGQAPMRPGRDRVHPETCDVCGGDRRQLHDDERCRSCGSESVRVREEREREGRTRVDPTLVCARCGRDRAGLAGHEACPECAKVPPSGADRTET